ncbi:metal-dependent hydrolase [Yinghuangia seranimata]|uniref:metal-dependent hydrolase n=1 Tax=Yinghuangia seranimata TaxID=408067 RepID=UPI00248C55EC|nr:metal-dependent hydrolase [Yinghuangia seranimata]MDI2124530.1 metal-dependent hydrolase [Yinghuangia seranimata]
MTAETSVSAISVSDTPIRPRRVAFDWENTPVHWIPGDAPSTHLINVLHLLLPAGEKWFVHVYKQALPLITDDKLREDVRGFMGQESVHSYSHAAVLDHLRDQGIDTRGYTKRLDWFFFDFLGDKPLIPMPALEWLKLRLSIIAAVEHFTALLGKWVLDNEELDILGADPMMMDLLRWHGAEEVEHRSVAFDLYQHLGGTWGRYPRRVEGMVFTAPALLGLWQIGASYLMRHDPSIPDRRYTFRDMRRAARQDRVPSYLMLIGAIPRYFKPSYHPEGEASTQKAIDYLATSPAALEAERRAAARRDKLSA